MDLTFLILAFVTVASGVAAISLRNLVHCALCFAACLLGIAGLFLWIGAQFAGFVQVLVYVGAISILVVFAILLTRGAGSENGERVFGSPLVGASIAILLGAVLLTCVVTSGHVSAVDARIASESPQLKVANGLRETNMVIRVPQERPALPSATVRHVGDKLMTTHVLALEIIALMLTVALLGAVTLAMPERKRS